MKQVPLVIRFRTDPPFCSCTANLIYKFITSVRLSDATVLRFNSPAELARTVGRTDRFCMGEPARIDGLCIISTNARWSVSQWRWVSRLICLWFSNGFWKKTKYPPRTVCNPTVLWSFSTHPEPASIFYGRTGSAGELKCRARFSSPTLLFCLWPLDAEKSDGGRREKWREKEKWRWTQ